MTSSQPRLDDRPDDDTLREPTGGPQRDAIDAPHHVPTEPARETAPTESVHERQDSGFFGAGSNQGTGDDNLARETTPGYQADKADRGTIMPR